MQGGDRDWLIAVSAGRYRLYSTTPDWYSPLKDTIIYLHLPSVICTPPSTRWIRSSFALMAKDRRGRARRRDAATLGGGRCHP